MKTRMNEDAEKLVCKWLMSVHLEREFEELSAEIQVIRTSAGNTVQSAT